MHTRYIKNGKVNLLIRDTARKKSNLILRNKVVQTLKHVCNCFELVLLGNNKISIGLNRKIIDDVTIDVEFCGAKKIRSLNKKFRNNDKVTDVLSFPIHEDIRKVEKFNKTFCNRILSLGDIIICKEVAIVQANEFKINLEDEIIHLLVHGFLHLCGFDHEKTRNELKLMESMEEELVKKIYQYRDL